MSSVEPGVKMCGDSSVEIRKLNIETSQGAKVEHTALVTHKCFRGQQHQIEEKCRCACGYQWVRHYK